MIKRFKATLLVVSLSLLGACAPVAPGHNISVAGLDRLRGEQEALINRVNQLQDNLLLLEARLHDQQQALDALRGTPSVSAPPAQVAVKAPVTVDGNNADLTPTDVYRGAFAAYTAGRYPEAASAFDSFLTLFPGNPYAANALFWRSEAYFAQALYSKAIDSYEELESRYPQSPKLPDALLHLALSLRQLDQMAEAGVTLSTLRDRFPQSSAAAKAKELFLPSPPSAEGVR